MDSHWAIEARAFLIELFRPLPLAHHFWVLIDPDGHIAGQLHGLATDPATGRTVAVGNSGHLLLAYDDPGIDWALQPGQPRHVCLTGDKETVLKIWGAAQNAVSTINALQTPYPNLWQHLSRPNSNSMFSLFAEIMGFVVPDRMPPDRAFAPGLRTAISREIVEQYRVQQ